MSPHTFVTHVPRPYPVSLKNMVLKILQCLLVLILFSGMIAGQTKHDFEQSFDNLYDKALQAYVGKGCAQNNTLYVVKEEWFEPSAPTKINDCKIKYVTADDLAELFQKEKSPIPIVVIRPIKNEGDKLIVALSNYNFSYDKTWRRKNYSYALEGGTQVKFAYDTTQNQFVIIDIKTWGV